MDDDRWASLCSALGVEDDDKVGLRVLVAAAEALRVEADVLLDQLLAANRRIIAMQGVVNATREVCEGLIRSGFYRITEDGEVAPVGDRPAEGLAMVRAMQEYLMQGFGEAGTPVIELFQVS